MIRFAVVSYSVLYVVVSITEFSELKSKIRNGPDLFLISPYPNTSPVHYYYYYDGGGHSSSSRTDRE